MKNRIELAEHFNRLGFKRGAEIGVCNGRYSKILCEKIPDLELIGIDYYRPYGGHGIHRLQSTQDDNLLVTREKLKDYPKYTLLINVAHEAVKWIADESLDFVFIDSDHSYEAVYQDIRDWAPKVRKGGIVSGHDYYQGKSGRMGVVKAVDEFIAENPQYTLETTEWDNEADRDDRQPDWYFTK